ncbi:MAG: type II/IV secretion system protein [Candidatus Pacebacteria bacterium]|nr:type II/IV secretion system protein [Candidatus Paceibacterota bacterium]
MVVQFDDASRAKLTDLHKQEEEALVAVLAEHYGIAHANLKEIVINADALRLMPEKDARRAEVAPFAMLGKVLSLAIRTPNNPLLPKIIKDFEERGYKAVPHMVSEASLEYVWSHYKDISFAIETEAGVLDVSNEQVRTLLTELTSLSATRKAVMDVLGMKKIFRITRTLEILIAGALANNASDIHIEPEDADVRIRFRLDGVLVEIARIDHETYGSALTRIKLLSGLKINIHEAAQDGRFSVRIDNREIEFRASLMPGSYGESIVMRLLDPRSIGVGLEALGIRPQLLEILLIEIGKPNGMILTTGPTGSGKTTTLYSFLKKVLSTGTKILTIEDPIEYHLPGIVQTQVNHKDYTFASGLRSALRQDPDVIMVGEIRDKEVAETAIHAALTGHLVFSTLHTNNAAGAFPRLIDIGINANMLGSAVNIVMAQRLLRTLNPTHRKEVPIEGKDKEFVDRVLAGIHDRSLIPAKTDTMWVPDAPEGETAYKGRVGVYEAIQTTRDIEDAVRKNLTIRELEDVARKQNFLSMHEDAMLKVLEGTTTLEEVRRILGETIERAV